MEDGLSFVVSFVLTTCLLIGSAIMMIIKCTHITLGTVIDAVKEDEALNEDVMVLISSSARPRQALECITEFLHVFACFCMFGMRIRTDRLCRIESTVAPV